MEIKEEDSTSSYSGISGLSNNYVYSFVAMDIF